MAELFLCLLEAIKQGDCANDVAIRATDSDDPLI